MTMEQTEKPGRKGFPLWGKLVIGVIAFLVLLVAGLRWFATTQWGRGLVEQQIEALEISGQKIELEGLNGDLLSGFTIDRLSLNDADGEWATIESVSFRWKPLGLLSRKLEINEFDVQKLHVRREPILISKEQQSSGEMPLKRIILQDFKLHDLQVDPGVTAEQVSGALSASADWSEDAANFAVQFEPGSETEDVLSARIGWTRTTPMNGNFTLVGPEGGLFASLLQLDDDQKVYVNFVAESGPNSVSGRGQARINDQDWIDLTINPVGIKYEVHTELFLDRHPMTRDLVERLGDEVSVNALLTRDADSTEKLEQVDVHADDLNIRIDQFVLTKPDKQARVDILHTEPSRLVSSDAFRLKSVSYSGLVTLSADNAVNLDGQLDLRDVRTETADVQRISGPITASFSEGVLRSDLSLDGENTVLRLNEPAKIRSVNLSGGVSYDTSISQAGLSGLKLSTPKSQVQVSGEVQTGIIPIINLNGTGSVKLSEFGLYPQGQVDAKWTTSTRSRSGQTFTIDVTGSEFAGQDSEIGPWIGNDIKIHAEGRIGADRVLNLSDLTVLADTFKIVGTGTANSSSQVDFQGELTASETFPLHDVLPSLAGRFDVNGVPDDLQIKVGASADRAGPDSASLLSPDLRFSGRWANQSLDGRMELAGSYESAPLTLVSEIEYSESNFALRDVSGDWKDLTLTGSMQGASASLETLEADFNLNGALPELIPAEQIELNLNASNGQLSAKGNLAGLNTAGISEGDLALDIAGSLDALNYDVSLTGYSNVSGYTQPSELALKGRAVDLTSGSPSTEGDLDISIGPHVFTTPSPYRFALTEQGYTGSLALSAFNGTVSLELDEASSQMLSASVSELDLQEVSSFLGRPPVLGTAEASLSAYLDDGTPRADLQGRLTDISLPDNDADPVSLNIRGEFTSESGEIRLDTPDFQMLQANVDLTVPVQAQASLPFLSYDANQNSVVNARLSGPVNNISALLLPEDMIVQGNLEATASGPLTSTGEGLSGRVSFDQGVVQLEGLGTDLENLSALVTLDSQVVTLASFSANGRKGGTLSGDGSMSLKPGGDSNVSIRADRLVVVNRKEARAVATGTLGMELAGNNYQITGDLVLNEGEFRLDSIPSSSAPTLDVQFEETEEREEKEQTLIKLNIDISAPHSLKLSGRGMDAELGLDATVSGTADNPIINGSARIVRGRFELLGKRFVFADSNIVFRGDPMLARLNIVAERDTDDFTARVTISGTPERPVVDLSAEPELPEDEVLSRVLFGRSPSQLSGLEAARLAAALASLSGGGGFDLMGGIEGLTGLDNVDVSQNADGQFQVATGRYLTDDIYMELSSGGTGAPGVSVEWEARDNVSVEAETKPEEGQKLSIQWKKDFE